MNLNLSLLIGIALLKLPVHTQATAFISTVNIKLDFKIRGEMKSKYEFSVLKLCPNHKTRLCQVRVAREFTLSNERPQFILPIFPGERLVGQIKWTFDHMELIRPMVRYTSHKDEIKLAAFEYSILDSNILDERSGVLSIWIKEKLAANKSQNLYLFSDRHNLDKCGTVIRDVRADNSYSVLVLKYKGLLNIFNSKALNKVECSQQTFELVEGPIINN